MIHRLPTNDHLRPYVKQILSLMLKLLEIENEENILVCLRIIIELHKQFRPTFNPEVSNNIFVKIFFLQTKNKNYINEIIFRYNTFYNSSSLYIVSYRRICQKSSNQDHQSE